MRSMRTRHTDWIHLELTSKCNLMCVYCPKKHDAEEGFRTVLFSKKQFDQLLPSLRKRGIHLLNLSGTGETTTREDWHQFAAQVQAMAIPCDIVTTLSRPLNPVEIVDPFQKERGGAA